MSETRPPAVDRALALIAGSRSERFADVAMAVFAFQYEHNEPYRRLCDRREATPETVSGWQSIPAVPTSAFKRAVLTCAPAERVFRTSGTTGGEEARGEHHLPSLELYEAAWREPFRENVLPDTDRIRIHSLIPDGATMPDSSLSFMMDRVMETFGSQGTASFIDADGMNVPDLIEWLKLAEMSGEPVLLAGTAFAFAHFLDALADANKRFELPDGSRIMDTGGFKGRTREISRAELIAAYGEYLGIPKPMVVGEYGMTELCSQFYETPLRHAWEGVVPPGPRVYHGQPWTRTQVLHPDTLRPVPPGEPGLLAHWDLANAWTVAVVVTEDVGMAGHGGFEVLGRAGKAELRGCSMTTEELLRG